MKDFSERRSAVKLQHRAASRRTAERASPSGNPRSYLERGISQV